MKRSWRMRYSRRMLMMIILTAGFLYGPFALGAPHSFSEYMERLSRKTPENGPVNTPVESWSILAPGTGGMGAATCGMCTKQMDLYDAIVLRGEPLSMDSIDDYYKEGQIGLYSEPTYEHNPRSYYPDEAFDALVAEAKKRGYDKPIQYTPPNTLVARIDWDDYYVPHVVGETIEDVTYGLGYATVYTNMFELLLIRFVGVSGILQTGLDIAHIDFSDLNGLFDQLKKFQPLNYTQAEMIDTLDPVACDESLGYECQEMLSALVAYREGINKAMAARYPVLKLFDSIGVPWPRWESADSVAAGLAITGVFGDPGADQIANLQRYRELEAIYGSHKAQQIFDDFKLRNAPLDHTTVTAKAAFPNPVYADGTNGSDKSRVIDADSIAWLDPPENETLAPADRLLNTDKPHASNWMVVSKEKSASGRPLLVGGPQMSYIQPNIFMEFDARTVDNSFQITGVSLPGLFIAAFAGNAHNGVWSPTSAIGKTSDLFVEKLCDPDGGGDVDPKSVYYMHNGECKQMRIRKNSGTPFTVHGPVVGWGSVKGEPVAITRKSFHAERMGQSIFPFYKLAKGNIKNADEFILCMEKFTLALNYAYINESEIAYINTGLYPVRAKGAQIDLPTWGTGEWDWKGVISLDQRPHVINPEEGLLLSWNNQSAPEFYESDGDFQRVQMLYNLTAPHDSFTLSSLAEISQTAAVQDGYAVTFVPLLTGYLAGLPDDETNGISEMMEVVDAWIATKQARRVDLNEDGVYDDPGPAIMDEIMGCIKSALEERLKFDIGAFDLPKAMGSAYQDSTTSLIRMLMNRARATGNEVLDVNENLLACGDGTYESCQNVIVSALEKAHANLTETFGSDDPSKWLKKADAIELIPLGKKEWHWQNRPTFQQVATVH